MDVTNPAAAENYKPHRLGYCCVDCNASAKVGQAVRHSSICDIAPKQFVLPESQDADESLTSKRAAKRGTSANAQARKAAAKRTVADSAKAGTAYADGFDDRDLGNAIRNGAISESDAMNQDF
jgi:hypothetical protein